MNQQLHHQNNASNDISFWGLFERVKLGWRWWTIGTCIGLLCAIGFLFLMSPQFESKAVVQAATIGIGGISKAPVEPVGIGGISKAPVEPVTQTLERLKLSTFYTDHVVKTCQAENSSELAKIVRSNVIKGNALLMISFRAASVNIAESCLRSIVQLLALSQDKVSSPLVEALKEQKDLTMKQINEIESFLIQHDKNLSLITSTSDLTSLLFLSAESKRMELLQLRKLYNDQLTLLTKPLTQPLVLLEGIYTSDRPVFPKKHLTILSGLMIGFFVGLFAMLINYSWRKRVELRKS